MSLTFRKLTLENFGPYRGRQEVDLSTPEGAPVILIHGENTMGKTQLFSALRWCLYGTFEPQQSVALAKNEIHLRMNLPARRDGESTLAVQIEFTAGTSDYRLRRQATIDDTRNYTSADLHIGATAINAQDQIETEIGRLLHPQISEFFLFDAELLRRFYERLGTDRERAFITENIEAVLGIPALQRAKNDVFRLSVDATSRQARYSESQTDAKRIETRLTEIRSRTVSAERDRTDIAERLTIAENRLLELIERLRNMEGLEADAREQEMLEASHRDGERKEQDLRNDMKTLISDGWRAFARLPLGQVLQQVEDANSEFTRNQERLLDLSRRVQVLRDRSRGGDCPTCGQLLPPPEAQTETELRDATAELEILEAAEGGELQLEKERRVRRMVDDRTIPQYVDKQRELSALLQLQYERQEGLKAINDRLQGHSAAQVRALGHEKRTLEEAVERARQEMDKVDRQLGDLAKEQQRFAKQLEKLPSERPEVVYEAGFYRFVDQLLEVTIESYRERVRQDVEDDARDMFLRLVRDPAGYGGLRISSDYKVEILDTRGAPRATSEGGKQLLALALIGALKGAAVRGGPVVLDSPLGRLDLEHRANVLTTWIPALGTQVILLVQSGELTKADANKLLGTSIGRSYEIKRPRGDPEEVVIEQAR